MCAFVVLGLVFPCKAESLSWGISPKWPILCQVGRKTTTQSTWYHGVNVKSNIASSVLKITEIIKRWHLLNHTLPSVLWQCLLGGRKCIQPVKKWGDGGGEHWLVRMEWCPARWSVCLLLLIFPCTISLEVSFLVLAHPGGSGKRVIKRLWWWWLLSHTLPKRQCAAEWCHVTFYNYGCPTQ